MAKTRSKTKPKGRRPPPVCKAILLCDQVIVDARTNKVSVIGIFTFFGLPQFPGQTFPVTAFLQLTNGIGKYALTVEIHDLSTGRVIARAELAEVEFEDRATKSNVVFSVPALPLQHPGIYDFVVLADDQEIDRQQFTALKIGGDDDGQETPDESDEGE
jgi:hypothetical protein